MYNKNVFRTRTQSFYFWILEHIATFCRNKILDLICFFKCFLKAKFYERKNTALSNFVKTTVLKYIEQKEKVKTCFFEHKSYRFYDSVGLRWFRQDIIWIQNYKTIFAGSVSNNNILTIGINVTVK